MRITDDGPLPRLFAGGRHVRLLMVGRPPTGLIVPDLAHFERVARVVRSGEVGPVVVDPLRLPFVEALFDKAMVTSALPRMTAKAELREVWRVLSPAGMALLVVKARRPWQWQAPGWGKDVLEPVIEDAMFEVLEWQIETIPDRWHLILVGKRDGLRPAMIGRVEAIEGVVAAG